MIEKMTQDKRFRLAEEICEIFVKHEAESQEAVSAMHIVMDLLRPSGLAGVAGEGCSCGAAQ